MQLITVCCTYCLKPLQPSSPKYSTFGGGGAAAGGGCAAAAAPPDLQALKRRRHLLADALGSPAVVTTTICEHCCAVGCYALTPFDIIQAASNWSVFVYSDANRHMTLPPKHLLARVACRKPGMLYSGQSEDMTKEWCASQGLPTDRARVGQLQQQSLHTSIC